MCGAEGGPLALEEEPAVVVSAGLGPCEVLVVPCGKAGGRTDIAETRSGAYSHAKGWLTGTAGGGPCGPGPLSTLGLRSPASEAPSAPSSAAPSSIEPVAASSVLEAAGKPVSARASSRTESCKGSRRGSMVAEHRSGRGWLLQGRPVSPDLRVGECRRQVQSRVWGLNQKNLWRRACEVGSKRRQEM